MPDTIGVLDKDGVAVTVKTNDALYTELAAILAKIIAAPATEAKQDTLIAKDFATQTTLAAVLAKIIAAPATEAKQDTLIAKDFATQTTLAAVLAKLIAAPATEAKQDTSIAANALIGTRAYGTGERVAVGSTSVQSAAIAATEVLIHANVRCFVKSGSDPTAIATGDSIPLEPGEKFHMRITSGHKVAVIRDTTDGFVHFIPVV